MSFPDKIKIREFVTTKPVLQKNIRGTQNFFKKGKVQRKRRRKRGKGRKEVKGVK